MIIEDGKGSGKKAEVNANQQLVVYAITEPSIGHVSEENGEAYTLTVEDTGPVAAEYTIYLQSNSSTTLLVVDRILLCNVDADVVWKIHSVTGTAAGAGALTPVNLNLSSNKAASATARGGAGGVTGLTSAAVIAEIFGGAAYSTTNVGTDAALVLGNSDAIAIEYDAGTGGKASITIAFHYE